MDREEARVSDEALIAGVAAGDEWATSQFVRRFERRIYGMARTALRDPALAEDVAQEVFIRVLRHAPVYDPGRASVSTWVFAIARNLVRDAQRLRRSTPIDPAELNVLAQPSTDRSPADSAVLADELEQLRGALAVLPDEQRRVVVLTAFYGRTCAEIAADEALPLGTVKGRLRLGMAKLRSLAQARER